MFSLPSYSQFLPDLQARTPAEFDAYLDILDDPSVEKAEAFSRSYPQSALLLPVYEILTKAWRQRAGSRQAIDAASRGLALTPDYAPLLVEFADLLANASIRLEESEAAAHRALDILTRAKAPLRVTPDVWTAAVAGLRARAHAALGLVKFKRDDTAGAMQEFEASLALASDPATHYRLGRLYTLAGRNADARAQLQQAARSTDKSLRALALSAIAALP